MNLAKVTAIALFGFTTYQAGADPAGTQEGIGSFFTSANAAVRSTPVLFNGVGGPSVVTPAPGSDPGMQVVDLPTGEQVKVPVGYRVVATGT